MIQKDTIYLDIDEEITNIIGKVQNSPKNIVALVLPKRASVLQSIVNMKLLKRAADQTEKKVVLITSEAGLLPLAGAAGIYVATNLNAKPYLPPSPISQSSPESDQTVTLGDEEIDPKTPVGDLIGSGKDDDDTIQIDNSAPVAAAVAGTTKAGKKKAGGKLSVPNFDRFRKQIFIGGALLLVLIVGLYWAFAIAPKATVTLKTKSNEVTAPISFTADTAISESKFDEQVLRADKKELNKTDTEKVPATGEKDKGTKAGGTVTLKNCTDNAVTIPAGTGVSSGGLTFISQTAVSLGDGEFNSGGQCKTSGNHVDTVNVVAQNNGDKYNLAPASYTVAGFSGVTGQGDQMSGGTSNKVKIISQIDIDAGKQKIADKQKTAKDELKQQFAKDNLVPLEETFSGSTPVTNATPVVDSEASEVTVTSASTYTMLAVKKDDLKKLVRAELKKKPDTEKQNVLDEGIDSAVFATGKKPSLTTTEISMQTTVILGPGLNQDDLKKQIAGKKSGEAESSLGKIEGVSEAHVELKPFWVTKIPGKPAKVNIIIQQANGQAITP